MLHLPGSDRRGLRFNVGWMMPVGSSKDSKFGVCRLTSSGGCERDGGLAMLEGEEP